MVIVHTCVSLPEGILISWGPSEEDSKCFSAPNEDAVDYVADPTFVSFLWKLNAYLLALWIPIGSEDTSNQRWDLNPLLMFGSLRRIGF